MRLYLILFELIIAKSILEEARDAWKEDDAKDITYSENKLADEGNTQIPGSFIILRLVNNRSRTPGLVYRFR